MTGIIPAQGIEAGDALRMPAFDQGLEQLRAQILAQGEQVLEMTLRAVECYFDGDESIASDVVALDADIDRVDVAIERAAVPLLALGETDHQRIRSVLTIVKINNELERAANCAVNIAEAVLDFDDDAEDIPKTFRVMANSVIGMLRDTLRAFETRDAVLAQRVLNCDDAVDQFKRQIGLDVQQRVAEQAVSVGFAFRLRTVVSNLERIADHCTNACQQVIYFERGLTVKHSPTGWSEPAEPEL